MAQPDLVGIVVQDMAKALAFYRLLGLDLPAEADNEGHVEFHTAGGFRIAWDSVEIMESIHPDMPPATGHRMALAFKGDSPEEVDEIYRKVVEAGHRGVKAPWDAFWGQRYAVVEDPDGNWVDLFANL